MTGLTRAEGLPRLAKYEVLEEIGHGGMATVYRARDLRLGREVAIKLIHKHLRESSEVAARFAAEARAVAKLRHPNIVEVYDVSDESDPERFLVVELLRGTTLRRVFANYPDLPPEIAASIALELASALAHAHQAGVIHRDIKPENVLLDPDQVEHGGRVVVKLTDFGIAKILDVQGVTSTGQVLGSPAHMAPEQIEGGEVEATADVFGLGVLLYEALTGRLPFEGKNPAQVLRRVLEGQFSPAERLRPTVGYRWGKIVARALAKEVSDRYASADALAKDVRAELEALGITDPQAELVAFFLDPDSYRTRHAARIVSLSAKRGEEARRKGDVHGAAADFNRALAYAPHDAQLLRLVSKLSRGRARKKVLTYVLGIVGASVMLGLAAYVISRQMRPRLAMVPPTPNIDESTRPGPLRSALASEPQLKATDAEPTEAAHPSSRSATPLARPATEGARSLPDRPARSRADSPTTSREVKFEVHPKGALVSIDGGPLERWFLETRRLAAGPHTFRAVVPDSRCCEELKVVREVIRGEEGAPAQSIALSLPFRSASLSVLNAPPQSRLRCPLLNVEGPGTQSFAVRMNEPDLRTSCELDIPGQAVVTRTVTLRAGEPALFPFTAP